MLKIKGIILSLLLLLVCIPVFSACEEPVRVSSVGFTINNYTMAIGATYQTEHYFYPTDATDKSVTYSSSNSAAVTVDKNGLITAVNTGHAYITIRSNDGGFTDMLPVTVIPELIQLAAPSGLDFDGSKLVWTKVVTDDLDYVPTYLLRIDGVEQPSATSLNQYSAIIPGKLYTIEVRARGNNSKYSDSDWSEAFSFKKLSSPAGITKNSGKLQFDPVTDASGYAMSIRRNNVLLAPAEKSLHFEPDEDAFVLSAGKINYEIPADIPAGEYTFSVTALGDDTLQTLPYGIYNSGPSAAAVIVKLAMPSSMQIADNILAWVNVSGAVGYKVVLTDSGGTEFFNSAILGAGVTSFVLPVAQIQANPGFEARVQALGDGINTLSSSLAGPCAAERLAAPGGLAISSFTPNQLIWAPVPNASGYRVKIGSGFEEDVGNITGFDLTAFVNTGLNQVWVVAYGDGIHYVTGNYSNPFSVRKLGAPGTFTVNRYGQIQWSASSFASGFVLYVNGSELLLGSNVTTYNLDYYFDASNTEHPYSAGNYYIKIKVLGNSAEIFDSDVFELRSPVSQDFDPVIKLSAPENLHIENGALLWDPVPNVSQYIVEIYIDGVTTESGPLQNTAHSISALLSGINAGSYSFRVKAMGADYPYVNSNYSDSLSALKLPSPYNLRVDNGVLRWEADALGALQPNRFIVQIGSSLFTTANKYLDIFTTISANVELRIFVYSRYYDEIAQRANVCLDSNPAGPFIAYKLSRPSNLGLSNNTLTWDAVIDPYGNPVDGYTVYVDYGMATETQFAVNGTSFPMPASLAGGAHYFRVKANGDMYLLLNSELSEQKNFVVLDKPNIYLENGVLRWSAISYNLNGITSYVSNYMVYMRISQDAAVAPVALYNVSNYAVSYNLAALPAGNFYISVVAIGNGSTTFSGRFFTAAEELTVTKLTAPLASSFKTLNNVVEWTAPANAAFGFNVAVKLKMQDGTLVDYGNFNENLTKFTLPNSFKGGLYQLTVRSVGSTGVVGSSNLFVTSNASDIIMVRRLTTPNGLTVASELLEWTQTPGANNYKVLINDEEGRYAGLTYINYSTLILDRSLSLAESIIKQINGALNIQVIANPAPYSEHDQNFYQFEDGARVLLASSAPSLVLTAVRYLAPAIYVEDGILTWLNNSYNQLNFGYEIEFEYNMQVNVLAFTAGENSYDLSARLNTAGILFEPLVNTPYSVKIRALGNDFQYITSNFSNSYYQNIIKLPAPKYQSENSFVILDGSLHWTHVPGAQRYGINLSYGITRGSPTVVNSVPDYVYYDGMSTITYLPQGQGGYYTLRVYSVGDSVCYINSEKTSAREFYKLYTPGSLRVEGGELEWDTRVWDTPDDSRRVSSVKDGAEIPLNEHITAFRVYTNGEKIIEDITNLNEQLILSRDSRFGTGSYSIRVMAVGSSWSPGVLDEALALSSEPTKQALTVSLINAFNDLRVENGELTWDGLGSSTVYGIRLEYQDSVTHNPVVDFSRLSTVNRTILRGLAALNADGTPREYKINIRHIGVDGTSGALRLNSEYSNSLSGIVKLPRPEFFGIRDGALAWDFGSKYTYISYTPDIGVYINDEQVSSPVPGSYGKFVLGTDYRAADENGAFIRYYYDIEASGDNVKYLTSDTYDNDAYAYKLPSLESMAVEHGLYITWEDLNSEAELPEGVTADKFVISYRITDKYSGAPNDVLFNDKVVIGKNKLPFWTLGIYEIGVSVANLSENAFRSDMVYADGILFNKFEAGEGTPEDPFWISDRHPYATGIPVAGLENIRLDYIKYIPDCYFELKQNVAFPAMQYGSNFDFIGNAAEPFTGGFNGNGFTITGYQAINEDKTGLFGVIEGGYRDGYNELSPGADAFMGRYGIVTGLAMNGISISGSGSGMLAAVAQENKGFIVDSTISGSIVYSAEVLGTSYAGGFVYTNHANGLIYGCVTNLNIDMSASSVPRAYVGGVAALNAGRIERCKNAGELIGNFVGGIAGSNASAGRIKESINAASGTVTGYANFVFSGGPHSSNGPAGGIAGENYGNIALCYNEATITSINLFSSNGFEAWIGGLAGYNNEGTISSSYSRGRLVFINEAANGQGQGLLGGLVGYRQSGTITNDCIFDSTVAEINKTSGNDSGGSGAEAYTTTLMQAVGAVNRLNTGNPGAFVLNASYPYYPKLAYEL